MQAVSRKQSEHESALASLNAKHKEESAKHTATVKQLNEEVSRLKQRLDEAGKQHGSLVSVVQTALSQVSMSNSSTPEHYKAKTQRVAYNGCVLSC